MKSHHVFHELYKALVTAQKKRTYMPLTGEGLYWNDFEMLTMYSMVNENRIRLGKDLIGFTEIVSAEVSASGHVDYTKKFALYCERLVYV